MIKGLPQQFEPRKTPVQARSTASVEAILEATIQVLLAEGKENLTTTRVAERAGVSVGTLYQYFPNKSALLQTVLRAHLDRVAEAMEVACATLHGTSLKTMGAAIASAFVAAKFQTIDASVALYTVSDDVEGKRIARAMHTRVTKAMAAALAAAHEKTLTEPLVLAQTMLSAMAGVSRIMLENGAKRDTMAAMHRELGAMMSAYLKASVKKK